MNEKDILKSLNNSVSSAPIDLLEQIKAQHYEKMDRHDKITTQKKFSERTASRLISFASVAAVFLTLFVNWQLNTIVTDSRIYLDVNPSISIMTNKRDETIAVVAGNSDAEMLLAGMDLKGKSVYLVTEILLERMFVEGYIDEREYMLLSISNKDAEKSYIQRSTIDSTIHNYLRKRSIDPIILSQKFEETSTVEKYAKEYGVSVGKITFIRNLIILDPDLKLEELVNLSIGELVTLSQSTGLDLNKIIETSDFRSLPEADEIQP